jgi:hypothetical protein
MPHELLRIGPHVTVVPIIHGSGDFALEVRRVMLAHPFDCVAVPLPPSFQEDVERAVAGLPIPTLVAQPETPRFATLWTPAEELDDDAEEEDGQRTLSYVPVDPCQGVITALRVAMGEHLPRKFIDLETTRFLPYSAVLPDPYALKRVPIERFAAALLPHLQRLPAGQPQNRAIHMANRLRQLAQRYRSILFVCSVLDWPWIREAFVERTRPTADNEPVEDTEIYQGNPRTLIFLFGELPFITGLYEQARAELEDDENLSIDGVKQLLLAARDSYLAEFRGRARRITPHLLAQCLKYIRNLSLIERRMTPDLYSIIIAAKQVFGDQYAIQVAETARQYPWGEPTGYSPIKLGVGKAQLPDGEIVRLVSRLPGPPVVWRSCHLQRRPDKEEVQRWRMQWNPFSQCSWPPEDVRIEDFRTHVFDRAKAVMGADLARTEKFTTSVMDGIDIRETLRHWYDDDIYVKVVPPSRGNLDCAVMLFDSPADPRDYPWRTTWYAEHDEESTLAFFATDFRREPVGPGICLATYGGALFLFPPVAIHDVWTDPRLDFTETLEERLLAAACLHSRSRHIALLSPLPPGAGWRRLARRFQKKWVHLPLTHFSDSTVQQLRMLHVLNGKEVRSYAAHFIRRA